MANYVEHDIPGKSTFTKLLVKHAVISKDASNISDALARIEKLTAARTELTDFLPALNGLVSAMKTFKAENKTKHPKFIKSLDKEVGEPTDHFLADVKSIADAPVGMRNFAKETNARLLAAAALVPAKFDAASIKSVLSELDFAANLSGGVANQAQRVLSKAGEIPKYRDAMNKVQLLKNNKVKIDMALQKIEKEKNYDADPQPIKKAIAECANLMVHVARA